MALGGFFFGVNDATLFLCGVHHRVDRVYSVVGRLDVYTRHRKLFFFSLQLLFFHALLDIKKKLLRFHSQFSLSISCT